MDRQADGLGGRQCVRWEEMGGGAMVQVTETDGRWVS